jgi:cell fate (sporulation/competence/biofilm development) regulator YlbF (YheA/YmcA/DUF963 family)
MNTKKSQQKLPNRIRVTAEQLRKAVDEGETLSKEVAKRTKRMSTSIDLEKEVCQLKVDNNRLKERIDELANLISNLEWRVYNPND